MDVFDTAALRRRVLAAWSDSPSRFREDANAEEELARGAYRDRAVIELAQNAADAASRARTPGRLLLRLHGSVLTAANTGAVLDAAGVEAMSTLRASAKRDDADAVGRFGVGFAAVLAVTDEPAVVSRSGAVRWSRRDASGTLNALADSPELAAELARRGDAVPVLRLPFPIDDDGDDPGAPVDVPDGYDTAIMLPLRDDAALAQVDAALAGVDEALLLALDWLHEIVVDVDGTVRTLTAGAATARALADGPDADTDDQAGAIVLERSLTGRQWRLARLTGVAADDLLADRPTEERARPSWSVMVAVPLDGDAPAPLLPGLARVVHAPTPTDDATDLPALLVATFPLDSSRRRVAPGALTDHLVEQVAVAYAALVASIGSPAALDLAPGLFGAGELDAALHRAVLARLAATSFVPATGGERLRPDQVVLVDGLRTAADPSALAAFVQNLPTPSWWRRDQLTRLGARTLALADVVDELSSARLEPAQWRELYAGLDGADPEAMGALPVLLADGRVVRGARGLLLAGEVPAEVLRRLGLRVVDPGAAHTLLRRLGANDATAAAVLHDPRLPGIVGAALDDAGDDSDAAGGLAGLSDAVLTLVAGAGIGHDTLPWLSSVPLPDATGQFAPAEELFFTGSPVLDVLDVEVEEYRVGDDVVRRHGRAVLAAVGVRDGWAVVREAEVTLDDEFWHDLDDEQRWLDEVGRDLPEAGVPPVVTEFAALRDLDLVRAGSWPQSLQVIAADPVARAALVDPVWAVLADGTRRRIGSYSAWWIRHHARVEGARLDSICTPAAGPVVRALLTSVALDLDRVVADAIGVPVELADVRTGVLLARLGDPGLKLSADVVRQVYAELAARDVDEMAGEIADAADDERGDDLGDQREDASHGVRVIEGTGSRVVSADDVVVVDGPHWLQLDLPASIAGDVALADALGVPTADEAYDDRPGPAGESAAVPAVVHDVLPDAPRHYIEHDELVVAGRSVQWWVVDGEVHAATTDGLAKGLAWAAEAWERRWLVAEALRDPDGLAALLAEDGFTTHTGAP